MPRFIYYGSLVCLPSICYAFLVSIYAHFIFSGYWENLPYTSRNLSAPSMSAFHQCDCSP